MMSTISIESMEVKADSPLDLSDGEKNQKQLHSPEGTIVKRFFFCGKKICFFANVALKKFDVTNRNALQVILMLLNQFELL